MKKFSVSVGIPAFNEEKNIKQLIKSILNQTERNWSLKEILVYCDGCTDKTGIRALEVKSKYVRVFDDKERRGKSHRVGQIFKRFSGDILVLLDADLRLDGKDVITNLVLGFEDSEVMLASGNKKPFAPKNFIEAGIYSTYEVFHESKIKINGGNNIFGCQGGFIALRQKFAKEIYLPKVISDDAYLYLYCITKGFKFKYVDNAVIYYKLASNLLDYLKQLFRATPQSVNIFLIKYFGERVKSEFYRPKSFYFVSISKAFMKRPFPTLFIIAINMALKPLIPFMTKKYETFWPTAISTK